MFLGRLDLCPEGRRSALHNPSGRPSLVLPDRAWSIRSERRSPVPAASQSGIGDLSGRDGQAPDATDVIDDICDPISMTDAGEDERAVFPHAFCVTLHHVK